MTSVASAVAVVVDSAAAAAVDRVTALDGTIIAERRGCARRGPDGAQDSEDGA